MYKQSFSGEVKDSGIVSLVFLFFMSLIILYPPLVLPLAHPREVKMELHV
jgi:hypothetical protein